MAKRGRPRKTDQGLSDSMIEMGYMAVMPGLDLAIQELVKLRDNIAGLLPATRNFAVRARLEPESDEPEPSMGPEPLRLEGLEPVKAPPAPKKKAKAGIGSDEARRKTGEAVAYRWRVVKEAGLKNPERGAPGAALVERAEKILARRESKNTA